eukprot:COSAG01_NODE_24731_length_768_cov_4.545590_1_plen_183_part_10
MRAQRLPDPLRAVGQRHTVVTHTQWSLSHHLAPRRCALAQVKERLAAGLARTLHEEEDGRAEMGPFTSAAVAERCARQLSMVEGLTVGVLPSSPPAAAAAAERQELCRAQEEVAGAQRRPAQLINPPHPTDRPKNAPLRPFWTAAAVRRAELAQREACEAVAAAEELSAVERERARAAVRATS